MGHGSSSNKSRKNDVFAQYGLDPSSHSSDSSLGSMHPDLENETLGLGGTFFSEERLDSDVSYAISSSNLALLTQTIDLASATTHREHILNPTDTEAPSPLMRAAGKGWMAGLKTLHEKGARLDLTRKDGSNAFTFALAGKHKIEAQYIFDMALKKGDEFATRIVMSRIKVAQPSDEDLKLSAREIAHANGFEALAKQIEGLMLAHAHLVFEDVKKHGVKSQVLKALSTRREQIGRDNLSFVMIAAITHAIDAGDVSTIRALEKKVRCDDMAVVLAGQMQKPGQNYDQETIDLVKNGHVRKEGMLFMLVKLVEDRKKMHHDATFMQRIVRGFLFGAEQGTSTKRPLKPPLGAKDPIKAPQ